MIATRTFGLEAVVVGMARLLNFDARFAYLSGPSCGQEQFISG